jgi:transcriptional regulator GlxA family with amidase domain
LVLLSRKESSHLQNEAAIHSFAVAAGVFNIKEAIKTDHAMLRAVGNGAELSLPPENRVSTPLVSLLDHVRDSQTAPRIEQTIAYMKEHLDKPLRAATLASVARMSLPHYFVIFKRHTGNTPIDYFIRLRMERARELLATTTCSVKEIAGILGYDDPLYFSRVFKAVNQTTPTQYRANHRVEAANGPARAKCSAPVGLEATRLQAAARI